MSPTVSIPLHIALRNCIVTSTSMAVGDAVCQRLEHTRDGTGTGEWCAERSKRMAIVGLFLSGPVSQWQHVFLERMFRGNHARAVASKVAAGAAMAPAVLSANFAFVGALQGHDGAQIGSKLRRDVGPTWLAGACYWPFVLALNFRLVPLEHRAVVSAAAGTAWHIYLSAQANKAVQVQVQVPVRVPVHVPEGAEHPDEPRQ